ncbi:metallophosphoesterase [Gloeothece citriformis PCC 7424]|uniref:Metallophosphoesterase n=1 Tax=Gloeothece citriformis (strain PCC 7424) TaxID=65393 RepID=B7KAY7_GLOC7|nr:metallophosphoesterase family protein [Gloeothece citriformis]ACK70097.1 metallophosphoesterase [Gloeothece citriformis PCC 7424]
MRTLAIGDIHGCLSAFNLLLEVIDPRPEDVIVTLGDYVDKGHQSKGVIDKLISLHKRGQLVALKGNHELMMLEARQSLEKEFDWLNNHDGKSTIDSYAKLGLPARLEDIPDAHWHFIEDICVDWWERDNHFFVHANIDPYLPFEEQPEDKLFWEKFINPKPHYSNKIMVCGHTSQKRGEPVNIGYAICIDTWACGDGWLTGLDIETGQIWQTNQQGQVKMASIDDFYLTKEQLLLQVR